MTTNARDTEITTKPMKLTTRIKNFFGLQDEYQRTSGYYWVKWSYSRSDTDDVWRIAWYNHRLGDWTMDGDTRVFYDADFLEIYERPIPDRRLLQLDKLGYTLFIVWMVLTLGYLIYQIISII